MTATTTPSISAHLRRIARLIEIGTLHDQRHAIPAAVEHARRAADQLRDAAALLTTAADDLAAASTTADIDRTGRKLAALMSRLAAAMGGAR